MPAQQFMRAAEKSVGLTLHRSLLSMGLNKVGVKGAVNGGDCDGQASLWSQLQHHVNTALSISGDNLSSINEGCSKMLVTTPTSVPHFIPQGPLLLLSGLILTRRGSCGLG